VPTAADTPDGTAVAPPPGTVRIRALPALHWSTRSGIKRNGTLWGSFLLERGAEDGTPSVYFAGDTARCDPLFADIGATFPIDLALLPIGAYKPRWFMRAQHCDPTECVAIKAQLRAPIAVATHFGTFSLTEEAVDDPVKDLAAAIKASADFSGEFVVPVHGRTMVRKATVD
jgi:N-acyl-phosphatidylethanolamine-hydrolysing phospholipase D